MKRQLYLNLLLLICTLMSWVDAGAADANLTLDEELQHVLDAELDRQNGIGISVAIRMPRRSPWHGVSGVSYDTTPLTSSMLFGIGSVTKNFVAALILQLAEEGRLSLDDALGKYLANYANINSAITIRQLLNHTSGIFDFIKHPSIWDTIFANRLKIWTPEEILETFVLQPYFSPGTGWHYSSTNYILLGMIVKEITGSKVSAELRERFFNPLGLDSTFFDIEEPITGTIAHPADVVGEPAAPMGGDA